MTRSPVAVTLLPLLPLAALAWPLAKVLNQGAYQPPPPAPQTASVPLTTADLYVQSAHPFEELSVTIGEATWTFLPGGDDVKEIHYPAGGEVILTVTVVWPPDTPETAALITLQPLEPEGRRERRHTLWGYREVTEEITFTWEDEA